MTRWPIQILLLVRVQLKRMLAFLNITFCQKVCGSLEGHLEVEVEPPRES